MEQEQDSIQSWLWGHDAYWEEQQRTLAESITSFLTNLSWAGPWIEDESQIAMEFP